MQNLPAAVLQRGGVDGAGVRQGKLAAETPLFSLTVALLQQYSTVTALWFRSHMAATRYPFSALEFSTAERVPKSNNAFSGKSPRPDLCKNTLFGTGNLPILEKSSAEKRKS